MSFAKPRIQTEMIVAKHSKYRKISLDLGELLELYNPIEQNAFRKK